MEENQVIGKRWSMDQKAEIAIRVIKGESIESLSRELQLAAATISKWHQTFLRFGRNGLKERPISPERKELEDAQRTIGKLLMENELLKKNFQGSNADKRIFVKEHVNIYSPMIK